MNIHKTLLPGNLIYRLVRERKKIVDRLVCKVLNDDDDQGLGIRVKHVLHGGWYENVHCEGTDYILIPICDELLRACYFGYNGLYYFKKNASETFDFCLKDFSAVKNMEGLWVPTLMNSKGEEVALNPIKYFNELQNIYLWTTSNKLEYKREGFRQFEFHEL